MKTEDAIKLNYNAPKEPAKTEAFERQVKDLVERYSSAHQLLDPEMDANQLITLKMKRP